MRLIFQGNPSVAGRGSSATNTGPIPHTRPINTTGLTTPHRPIGTLNAFFLSPSRILSESEIDLESVPV
jgi:hypothetical protein